MADNKEVRMSSHKPSSNWWSNALRSIGSSSVDIIKDMVPYTAATVTSVGEAAKGVRDNIRKASSSGKSTLKAFENSSLIKSAREGLRNAKEDLKTGNLNNQDRKATSGPMAEMSAEMDEAFDDVSFDSFGDEDSGGDNYNTAITNNYGGDNAYLADTIAEGFKKSTNANIAAGNAQVNALVASTSNAMMANQKFFTEISGKVDSIDRNIAAIVEYLNTNVTKLIEANAAYYSQQSPKSEGENTPDASSVFGGASSGLNLAEYKKLIQKQFGETEVGGMYNMLAPMLQNGGLGELMKNPLGNLIKYGVPNLISPALKKAFSQFDKSVRMALPAIAERIAEYGEENGGVLGTLAKIFGVKTKVGGKISNRHFSNAQIPWDKESKNALIRIIPGYLGKILQAVRGDKEVERWDNTTMSFRKDSEIMGSYLKEVQDDIARGFAETDIGNELSQLTRELADKDKATGEKFDKLVNMFYEATTTADKRIQLKDITDNPEFIKSLIAGNGEDKDARRAMLDDEYGELVKLIEELVQGHAGSGNDGGLNFGRQQARLGFNASLKRLDENTEGLYNDDVIQQLTSDELIKLTKKSTERNNGNAAISKLRQDDIDKDAEREKKSFIRTIDDIRYLLDRGINVKIIKGGRPFSPKFGNSGESDSKENTDNTTSTDQKASTISAIEAVKKDHEQKSEESPEAYNNAIETAARDGLDKATGVFTALINGGTNAAGNKLGEIFKEGFDKVKNFAKEHIANPISDVLFGEKDETGKRQGGVFHQVSTALSDYLLGPKKEGEEGRGEGFLSKIKGKFNEGIDGWAKTIFGDDVQEGETPEQAAQRRRKQMKGLAAKGAVGVGAGILGANLMQGSLLGMAVNPALGALMGLGGVIAANSKSFKKMLFGEDEVDENGQKTGKHIKGLISLRTQEFFKKNGKMILGGAAFGAIKSLLIPSSGGILSSIVGGPVAGMLIGAGIGMVKQTGWFQNLMFGHDITDSNGNVTGHVDGLKDKVKKFFSKSGGKNGTGGEGYKAGMTLLASLGGAGIGGLMGVAAGPLIGGLLGAGIGIAANSEKFKTALFGGKGEDGKRHGGLFGKIAIGLDAHVISPLKDGFLEIKEKLGKQTKKIGAYLMIAMQPMKDAFDHFKERIHQSISHVFRNIEAGLNNVLVKPLKGAFKLILKPIQTLGKGIVSMGKSAVQAPFKLLGAGLRKFGEALDLHNKKNIIKDHLRAFRHEISGFVKAGFSEMFKPITDGIGKIKDKIGKSILGFLTKKGGPQDKLMHLINDRFGTTFTSIGDMLKTGFKKMVMAPFKLIGKIIAAPFKLLGAAFKGVGAVTHGVTGGIGMLASMGNTKRIDANKGKLSNAEKAKEYYQLSSMEPSTMTHEQQARLEELRGEVRNGKLNLRGMKNASDAQDKINRYQENINAYQASTMVDENGNPITMYQKFKDNAKNMTFSEKMSAIFRPGANEAKSLNRERTFYSAAAFNEYEDFKKLSEKREQGVLTDQEKNSLDAYEAKFGQGKSGLNKAKWATRQTRKTHNIQEEFALADDLFSWNEEDTFRSRDRKNATKAKQLALKLSKGDVNEYNRLLREYGVIDKDKYDHSMDRDAVLKAHGDENNAMNTLLSGYSEDITNNLDKNLDGAAEFFNKGLNPGSIYTNDVHSVGILQQIYKFLVGALTGETVTDRDLDKMSNPQKYTTAGRLGEKYAKATETKEGKDALIKEWAVDKYGEERADYFMSSGNVDMDEVKDFYMKSHEAEAAQELADEEAADKEAAKALAPVAAASIQLAGADGSTIIDQAAPISTGSKKKKRRGKGRKAKKRNKGTQTVQEAVATEDAVDSSDDTEGVIEGENATLTPAEMPSSEQNTSEFIDELSTSIATKNDAENDANAQLAEQQEIEKQNAEEREATLNSSNEALEKKLEMEREIQNTSLFGLIANATAESVREAKSHNSVWDSIFSKKGLITAGLIALAPLLLNLLNGGLGNLFKDLFGDLGSLISNVLGNFWDSFESNGGFPGLVRNVLELGERGMKLLKGDVIGAITNEEGDVDNLGASTLRSGTRSIIKTTATNSTAFVKGAQKGVAEAELKTAEKALQNSDEVRALVSMGGKNADEAATLVKQAASGSDEAIGALKAIGVDKVSDATKATIKTADTASDVAKAAAKYGNDVAEAAAKGGSTIVKKAGGKVGNIVSNLVDWTKEAIAKLNKMLGEKFGKIFGNCKFMKKLTQQCTDTFLTKAITESFPRFGKVLAKMGISTGTAFIAELVFVGLGALDGTARTAYMFDCSKNDVDYIMVNISTVFGALLATSVGGVFDVVNSIIEAVCGWNPVKCIAQELYKLLVDDEMEAQLKESQAEFKKGWKAEAYKRYTENNTDGLNKLSEEEFMALSDADIANKSEYEFNDYNNSVNAGLTDQAVKGAVDFGKRTADKFSNTWSDVQDFGDGVGATLGTLGDVWTTSGDAVATLGRGAGTLATTAGTAWQSAMTGVYAGVGGLFGDAGKAAGETLGSAVGAVGSSALEVAGMGVEAITGTASGIAEWADIGISGLGDMIAGKKTWDDVMADYSNFWNKTADNMGTWWNQHAQNFTNIWNNVTDSFSNWWSEVTKTEEERAAEAAEKARQEAEEAEKAQEEALNAQSDAVATLAENYGSDLRHRMMTNRDAVITSLASGGIVTSDEPILSMLSPGEIVINPADKKTQRKQELAEKAKARDIIHSNATTNDGISRFISGHGVSNNDIISDRDYLGGILSVMIGTDVMNASTSTQIHNAVGSFLSASKASEQAVGDDDMVEYKSMADNVTRRVKAEESRALRIIDAIKQMSSRVTNAINNTLGKSVSESSDTEESGYGRGDKLTKANKAPKMYQQEDPRWSQGSYQSLDIHDSGCGPTAAAIAASAYGSNMNPAEAAAIVNASGNRDLDGGTRPRGIEIAGKAAGVSMSEGAPDNKRVISNLLEGKPVILMGEDGKSGRGDDSVYGNSMHYVVATGYDPTTGKVDIADPLKPKSEKHSIRNVMGNAVSTIYTGNKSNGYSALESAKMGRGPFYKTKENIDNPTKNDNAISFLDYSDLAYNDMGGAYTVNEAIHASMDSVYGYPSAYNDFISWVNSGYAGSYRDDVINTVSGVASKTTLSDVDTIFFPSYKPSDRESRLKDTLLHGNAAIERYMTDTQSDQMSFPSKMAAANLWRYYRIGGQIKNGIAPAAFYNNIDKFVANSHRDHSPYSPGTTLELANDYEYDSTKVWQPYAPKPYMSGNDYVNSSYYSILQQNKVFIEPGYLYNDWPAISAEDLIHHVEDGLNMDLKYDKGISTQYADHIANGDNPLDYLETFIRDALAKVNSSWAEWKCGDAGIIPDPSSQLFTESVEVENEDYGVISVPSIAVFPVALACRGLLSPANKSDPLIKKLMGDGGFNEFANSLWNNDHFGDLIMRGMPYSSIGSLKRTFNSEPILSYWPVLKDYFSKIDLFIKTYISVSDDVIDRTIRDRLKAIRKALNEIQVYDSSNKTKRTKASDSPFTLSSVNTALIALWDVLFRNKSVDGFRCDNDVKLADMTNRCLMFENQDKNFVAVVNKWLSRAYELAVISENSVDIKVAPESVTKFKLVGNLFQLEVARAVLGCIKSLEYVEPTDTNSMNIPAGKSSNAGLVAWAYNTVMKDAFKAPATVAALYDSSVGGKITGTSPVTSAMAEKICDYLYAGDVLFYASTDMADGTPNHVELYIGDGYMAGHYKGVKGPVIHKVDYKLGTGHVLSGVKRFIKNEDHDCHEMEYDLDSGKYVVDGTLEGGTSSNALSAILGLFGELANRLVQGVFTGNWDTDMSSYMNGGNAVYSGDSSLLDYAEGIATKYGNDDTMIVGSGDESTANMVDATIPDATTQESSESGTGRRYGRGLKSRGSSSRTRRSKSKGNRGNLAYGRGRRKYGRGNKYTSAGETVTLPKGAGWYRTTMPWSAIANTEATNQGKLKLNAGENYDDKGYAKIGDRYVIATTQTFGEAGDYIDVNQSDGTTVKGIIGDIKAWGNPNEPVTKWGHTGGENVLEFIDKKGSHTTIPDFGDHKEWYGVTVTSITNRGTSEYVGGSGLVDKSGVESEMSYDKSGHDKTPGSPYISWKVAGGHTKFDGVIPITDSYEESMYSGSAAGDYGGTTADTTSSTSSSESSSSGMNTISNTISKVTNDAGASGLTTLSNAISQLGNDVSTAVFGDPSMVSSRTSSSSSGGTAQTLKSSNPSSAAKVGSSSSTSIKSPRYVDQNNMNTADGWFLHGGIGGTASRSEPYSGHKGIDYGAPTGADILSPVDGEVVLRADGPDGKDVPGNVWSESKWGNYGGLGINKWVNPSGFGNYTVIRDDVEGMYHIFAHQNVPNTSLAVGTHIKRGDKIGVVGSTGLSTGSHLHYQISPDNGAGFYDYKRYMDPNDFDFSVYSKNGSGRGRVQSNSVAQPHKNYTVYTDKQNAAGGGGEDLSTGKIITLLETLVIGIESIVTNTGNSVTGLDKVKKAMEEIKIENTTNNNVVAPSSSGGTQQSKPTSTTETYGRRIARGH